MTTTMSATKSAALPRTGPRIDFAVGGQAVIEGVMMRSPNHITVAVRKTNGNVTVKEEGFRSIAAKLKFLGLPLVRGVVNLFEMMIVGMRMLNFSANVAMDEEETDESKATKFQKVMMIVSFAFSVIFALGMSLFMFKFIPLWITDYLSKSFAVLRENYLAFNLTDGVIKTVFFVAYIGLIGLMPSLRRVFQYHGAEHKSIYTYENGLDLTVENARRQTRFHPRCGTSFILVVFLISIFVYTFVPRQEDFFLNFFVRVLFLPLIAGISYEFLKWSARRQGSAIVRIMTAPGLMFQRLTTREPEDDQLEVALTALRQALALEAKLTPAKQKVELTVG